MEIESGIPIPPMRSGRTKTKLPFADMQVGDSVLVPVEDGRRMIEAAGTFKRRHDGWDYTTRMTSKGLRIWRTG